MCLTQCLLSVSQNPGLATLLGTKFGGDGLANFKLPNLNENPTLPYGMKYQICVNGAFPEREYDCTNYYLLVRFGYK